MGFIESEDDAHGYDANTISSWCKESGCRVHAGQLSRQIEEASCVNSELDVILLAIADVYLDRSLLLLSCCLLILSIIILRLLMPLLLFSSVPASVASS